MSLILKKVLISDDINPQCAEIMVKNGIEVAQKTKLTKEQLIAEIPVGLLHVLFTPVSWWALCSPRVVRTPPPPSLYLPPFFSHTRMSGGLEKAMLVT